MRCDAHWAIRASGGLPQRVVAALRRRGCDAPSQNVSATPRREGRRFEGRGLCGGGAPETYCDEGVAATGGSASAAAFPYALKIWTENKSHPIRRAVESLPCGTLARA